MWIPVNISIPSSSHITEFRGATRQNGQPAGFASSWLAGSRPLKCHVKYLFWALQHLNGRKTHQASWAYFPFLFLWFLKRRPASCPARTEGTLEHGDQHICKLECNYNNRREVHIVCLGKSILCIHQMLPPCEFS